MIANCKNVRCFQGNIGFRTLSNITNNTNKESAEQCIKKIKTKAIQLGLDWDKFLDQISVYGPNENPRGSDPHKNNGLRDLDWEIAHGR